MVIFHSFFVCLPEGSPLSACTSPASTATQQLPHVKSDARPILGSRRPGDQGIVSTSSSPRWAIESTRTYIHMDWYIYIYTHVYIPCKPNTYFFSGCRELTWLFRDWGKIAGFPEITCFFHIIQYLFILLGPGWQPSEPYTLSSDELMNSSKNIQNWPWTFGTQVGWAQKSIHF